MNTLILAASFAAAAPVGPGTDERPARCEKDGHAAADRRTGDRGGTGASAPRVFRAVPEQQIVGDPAHGFGSGLTARLTRPRLRREAAAVPTVATCPAGRPVRDDLRARLISRRELTLVPGGNLTHGTAEGIVYPVGPAFDAARVQSSPRATDELNDRQGAHAGHMTVLNPQVALGATFAPPPPVIRDAPDGGAKAGGFEGRFPADAAPSRTADATSAGIAFDRAGEPFGVAGGVTALGPIGEQGGYVCALMPRRAGRLNVTDASAPLPPASVGASARCQPATDRSLAQPAVDGPTIDARRGDDAPVDSLDGHASLPDTSLAGNIHDLTDATAISCRIVDRRVFIAPCAGTATSGNRFK